MAHTSVPLSSTPAPAGPNPSVLFSERRPGSAGPLPPHQSPDIGKSDSPTSESQNPEQVIGVLRTAVAAGDVEMDTLLQYIAEAAHSLTGANGAAIAMRRHGLIICQARAGETAPDLGTKLDADSDISGECLRTGRALRCDDTDKDLRVDAEVCRRLGLRSLAAAPLCGKRGSVGIIEVFSARPYSFPDRHLDLLRELAELVMSARARFAEKHPLLPEEEVQAAAILSSAVRFTSQAAIWARHALASLLSRIGDRRQHASLPGVAVLGIVILAALTGFFLRIHGKVSNSSGANAEAVAKAPESVTPASDVSPSSEVALVWKPGADTSPAEVRSKPTPAASEKSSESGRKAQPGEVAEDVVRRTVEPADASHGFAPGTAATPGASQLADQASPGENALVLSGHLLSSAPNSSALANVLSTPPRLPQPAMPVSQGISEGMVEYRVKPSYPSQARTMRLEGPVLLQAVITENGTVQDLKVVRGQPILARAAVDAVQQWHYRPYRLNGKPVRMQTEITIDFKLP
jgi:TonB family protein